MALLLCHIAMPGWPSSPQILLGELMSSVCVAGGISTFRAGGCLLSSSLKCSVHLLMLFFLGGEELSLFFSDLSVCLNFPASFLVVLLRLFFQLLPLLPVPNSRCSSPCHIWHFSSLLYLRFYILCELLLFCSGFAFV